jgi:hypothetical protein
MLHFSRSLLGQSRDCWPPSSCYRKTILKTPGLDAKDRFRPIADVSSADISPERHLSVASPLAVVDAGAATLTCVGQPAKQRSSHWRPGEDALAKALLRTPGRSFHWWAPGYR